jgi:predicted Rossmann fold nucleotide-binding protein DprA/Smf involved in DNA uptake
VTQPVYLTPDHPSYPTGLRTTFPAGQAPTLSLLGDQNLLNQPALALFCSVKCPGDLILNTYDLAQALRAANISVMSGFHSPMEKECLRLLLRGTQAVLHAPARSLEGIRLSPGQKQAIQTGRLLLLSPFPAPQRRATAALAERRNQIVGAIALASFMAYASPGGKTEAFAQNLIAQGKPLFTFESPNTENLLALGAKAVTPPTAPSHWHSLLKEIPSRNQEKPNQIVES